MKGKQMSTVKHPEKIEEANRWLDKAVAFEGDESKSEKMVEMAFKKAVTLEDEAFAD